jgi:hypothetical protein
VWLGDRFAGVAAIDVKFKFLVDELLLPPSAYDVDAWLVDGDGNQVVHSALRDKAGAIRHYETKPFPYPDVLAAAEEDELLPHLEHPVDGAPTMFAWSRLEAVDYLYVVSATMEDLLQ